MTNTNLNEQNVVNTPCEIFVYGTLKKDHGNHYLIKDCELVTDNHVLEDYKLVGIQTYYPAMIKSKGDKVVGEVYKVKDSRVIEQVRQLEHSYLEETYDGLTYYIFDEERINRWNNMFKEVKPDNNNTYKW